MTPLYIKRSSLVLKNEPNEPNWTSEIKTMYLVRISDTVRNPNDLTIEPFPKAPKSEPSDLGRLLYSECPNTEH